MFWTRHFPHRLTYFDISSPNWSLYWGKLWNPLVVEACWMIKYGTQMGFWRFIGWHSPCLCSLLVQCVHENVTIQLSASEYCCAFLTMMNHTLWNWKPDKPFHPEADFCHSILSQQQMSNCWKPQGSNRISFKNIHWLWRNMENNYLGKWYLRALLSLPHFYENVVINAAKFSVSFTDFKWSIKASCFQLHRFDNLSMGNKYSRQWCYWIWLKI